MLNAVKLAVLFFCFSSLSQAAPSSKSKPAVKTSMTYREVWKRSASHFSGDVFLLPKSGNFFLDEKDFRPEKWHASTVKGKILPPHPITMHGVAWDYDLDIPIAFYDPTGRWFKPGSYAQLATQQDIAPTISRILNIPPPAQKTGRVLSEALQKVSSPGAKYELPRVIVVIVQDQAGRQFFAAHPGRAPFLKHFMTKGANFQNATVSHVDVETSVGHIAVGTGAWPPEHGVSGNDFFHTGLWKSLKAFTIPVSADRKETLIGNPSFLFTPTVADIWITMTEGKAKVLSQVYAPRASIGMAGHGATFAHGKKTNVVWMNEYDDHADTYVTDEKIYELPNSYRSATSRSQVERLTASTPGLWRGHKLFADNGKIDSDAVKASPAQSAWEADLAVAALKELKIGDDSTTDLVFINTKATDACGHRYGFESDECGDVFAASDDAARRIIETVAELSGGSYFAVLTADHGAAPLPELTGAARFSRERMIKDLNQKFDTSPNHLNVVLSLTSSQLYLNRHELAANGFKVSDVVKFLRNYRVPFEFPYNALAPEWIKKGRAKEQLFFQDVVSREDL